VSVSACVRACVCGGVGVLINMHNIVMSLNRCVLIYAAH